MCQQDFVLNLLILKGFLGVLLNDLDWIMGIRILQNIQRKRKKMMRSRLKCVSGHGLLKQLLLFLMRSSGSDISLKIYTEQQN